MENKKIQTLIPDDAFMFRRGKCSIDGFERVNATWDMDIKTQALKERVDLVGEFRIVSACSIQSDTPEIRKLIKERIRCAVWKHFYSGLASAMDELTLLIDEGKKEKALQLACKIRGRFI